MKGIAFRLMLALSLLLSGLAMVPAPVAQAAAAQAPAMPASLQDAFFAASSEAFDSLGTSYRSEHNGLTYGLDSSGLQAQADGLRWSIALRGIGKGNVVQQVAPPEIVQTETELEYRRGSLMEWYRDVAVGVEQGFIIDESPRGNGKLVLHLDLSTNVGGRMDADERGLSFASEAGGTLRYDQLKAYDAKGVELEARFIYNPAQVVIQVDDQDAAYPVTIDPFIYLEQKVLAPDGAAWDSFGYSVALSGDTALVGALGNQIGANDTQGAAYVFVRSGGAWTLAAKLTAWDGEAYDEFGVSVALSGDTALVGADGVHVGANADQGSAYVFVKPSGGWVTTSAYAAKLTASDGAANDWFGWSVAISGDTALVGTDTENETESAYIFVKPAGGWATGTETAKLTASDGQAGDAFGWSVALSGDTALVGAVGTEFVEIQGSAYVFVKPGGGWATGTETAKLTASDGEAYDDFGKSVALLGDTALVGADGDNDGRGSAYVFVKPGGGWVTTSTFTAKLTASDGAASDRFGYSVALSGDTALVGAYAHGGNGSAYVFVRPGGGWSTTSAFTAKLTASDGATNDHFGNCVAISGDTALVAAPVEDTYRGSAYLYEAYRSDTDLGVAAGTSAAVANAGDAIYLTAAVMNYGPSSAGDVRIDAPVPSGLSYGGSVATNGAYDAATGSWTIASLPAGVGASLTIAATVNAALGTTMTFSAASFGMDLDNSNNSASVSIKVGRTERLINGGFNTYVGTSKIPRNWTATNFSSSDGKYTAVKKEGTASVQITGLSGKTKSLKQVAGMSGPAGNSIAFTFWVKSTSVPATGICRGQAILYAGAAAIKTQNINCPSGTTSGFVKKTVTFTSPGAYTSARVIFTYSKASGTVLLDGASLQR